jgi:hypothetical protein
MMLEIYCDVEVAALVVASVGGEVGGVEPREGIGCWVRGYWPVLRDN